MTATTSTNGRTRKSLAEQIDRLDGLLDGLAENLTEAVTAAVDSAVKEAMTAAVREAVRAAVVEVLTAEEHRRRPGVMPTPAGQPPVPGVVRLADTARRALDWLAGAAMSARDTVRAVARRAKARALKASDRSLAAGRANVRRLCEQAAAKSRAGWLLLVALAALGKPLRGQLLVALGVGVMTGLVAYLAGPLVVPVACGLAGFVASLLAGVWMPLGRRASTPAAGGGWPAQLSQRRRGFHDDWERFCSPPAKPDHDSPPPGPFARFSNGPGC